MVFSDLLQQRQSDKGEWQEQERVYFSITCKQDLVAVQKYKNIIILPQTHCQMVKSTMLLLPHQSWVSPVPSGFFLRSMKSQISSSLPKLGPLLTRCTKQNEIDHRTEKEEAWSVHWSCAKCMQLNFLHQNFGPDPGSGFIFCCLIL